jgi:hypothetical protein
MITNMSDYEIIDYLIINCVEPKDMIFYNDNDYLVKSIEPTDEGWDLLVVDRMEDEIVLFVPDAAIVGLLGE